MCDGLASHPGESRNIASHFTIKKAQLGGESSEIVGLKWFYFFVCDSSNQNQ